MTICPDDGVVCACTPPDDGCVRNAAICPHDVEPQRCQLPRGHLGRHALVGSSKTSLELAAPDLYEALQAVADWFDAINHEQHQRTVVGQTLESASRNWELSSDVPSLDMAPIKAALQKAKGTP